MKEIAGMPVREACGRECVLVGYGHGRYVAQLAVDLNLDTPDVPDDVVGSCSLCPAAHPDDCAGTDCVGGFLVDTKWLPLLLMRLPAQNPNS